MEDPKSYDGLSSVVFIAGIYEGVVPFLAKLVGIRPFLAFPARLGAPLWWLVSGAVIVVATGLLWAIDVAKTRRHPGVK